MATVEERVENLENDFNLFKGETVNAYRDMAMHITIVKGLAEDSVERLKHLEMQVKTVDMRVEALGTEVRAVGTQVGALGTEVRILKQDVNERFRTFEQSVNRRFETLEHRLDEHDGRFDRIEALLGQVLERLA